MLDQLDDLADSPVVEMICALDALIPAVCSRECSQLLGIFVEESGFLTADDRKQRAADPPRIGTAIVAIIFAVLVYMRAGGKDTRRRADGHRQELFAFILSDFGFCLFDKLAKARLARGP